MISVKFIAEIGSNWWRKDANAGLDNARQLISEAKRVGANIVKLQIFTADTLYSKDRAPDLYARAKEFQMPLDFLSNLRSHANFCGIELWASVFDPEIAWTYCGYIQGIKIASGDITYYDLIEQAAKISAKCKYPLSISTGAATEEEIGHALDIAHRHNPHKIILFHCNSTYPAEQEAMNLRAGTVFRDRVDAIGLSDHTMDNVTGCLAVGLGYTYFEKHFRGMLDKDSPDALISVTPVGYRSYVEDINKAIGIYGEARKKIFASEVPERKWARRGKDGLRPNL